MRDAKGFTLVEMVVAMGIFALIMSLSSLAFQRVLTASSSQTKSAQSNIDGIAGLDILRYDVEHAGYGLPWRFQNYSGTIQFRNTGGSNLEVDVAANALVTGIDSNHYNAVQSTNVQAFAGGSSSKEVNGSAVTNASGGPDYLVIRSALASFSSPARKWSYLNYSASGSTNLSYLKRWNSAEDFSANDRIVTISSTFTTLGKQDKILLMNGNEFEVALPASLALPSGDAFKPGDATQTVVAYGLRNSATSGLRMPYNRTDFYVSRVSSEMPPYCNAGTGVLYKASVDHSTGRFSPRDPILDCVGDLQLEFDYDAAGDGSITPLSPELLSALSASEIRDGLKMVRVYILAHEGQKDRSFSYPADSIHVGNPQYPTTSGRTLAAADMQALFGSDWRNYRWKIYTLVTRPKNLSQ